MLSRHLETEGGEGGEGGIGWGKYEPGEDFKGDLCKDECGSGHLEEKVTNPSIRGSE